MLMIMFQMVNHSSIKKKMVGETLEIPQQTGNSGDANQSNTAISTNLKRISDYSTQIS